MSYPNPIRYDIGGHDCYMEQCADGDYVEYDEYKKLLEEYTRAKAELDLLHLAKRVCYT